MQARDRVRRQLPFSGPGVELKKAVAVLDPLSPPPRFAIDPEATMMSTYGQRASLENHVQIVNQTQRIGQAKKQKRVEVPKEWKMVTLDRTNVRIEMELKAFLHFDKGFEPLLDLLADISLDDNGVVFDRKIFRLESAIFRLCPDKVTLDQAFGAFRAAALKDEATARTLAAVGASFSWQAHRRPLRQSLVDVVVKETLEKLELLTKVDPKYLINAATFTAEYFGVARNSKGERMQILATTLVQYFDALLASEDTHAHRIFGILLMSHGYALNLMLPHKMDQLSISIRKRLLEPPTRSAIWFLLAADLCMNKFLELPMTLQEFYFDNMGVYDSDSSIDSSSSCEAINVDYADGSNDDNGPDMFVINDPDSDLDHGVHEDDVDRISESSWENVDLNEVANPEDAPEPEVKSDSDKGDEREIISSMWRDDSIKGLGNDRDAELSDESYNGYSEVASTWYDGSDRSDDPKTRQDTGSNSDSGRLIPPDGSEDYYRPSDPEPTAGPSNLGMRYHEGQRNWTQRNQDRLPTNTRYLHQENLEDEVFLDVDQNTKYYQSWLNIQPPRHHHQHPVTSTLLIRSPVMTRVNTKIATLGRRTGDRRA